MTITKQSFSVQEFCNLNSISRAKFYLLIKECKAPKMMKIGRRRLISAESALNWRLRMEAESN